MFLMVIVFLVYKSLLSRILNEPSLRDTHILLSEYTQTYIILTTYFSDIFLFNLFLIDLFDMVSQVIIEIDPICTNKNNISSDGMRNAVR